MSVPPPPKNYTPTSRLVTLLCFLAITVILYFGRDILIPIALAILLSFLLSPLVLWLERRGIKRVFAVVFLVMLLMGFVGGLGYMLAGQFVEFVDNLPKYRKNIVTKVHAIKPGNKSVFKRAEAAFKDISREMETETTTTAQMTTGVAETSEATTLTTTALQSETSVKPATDVSSSQINVPGVTTIPGSKAQTNTGKPSDSDARTTKSDAAAALPVRVVEGPPNTWQTFVDMVSPIVAILGNAGLVILIVIFFLLEREDLRDRIIRLAGQNKVRVTTEALEEASARVSRYLLMQLIVNVTYGIPVALGLWLIGVPNALLWGAMATILRFIPYIGPWIAAAMPIALSLAVFDNWTMPLLTVGLFVVLELLSNNIMEPMLYGHSTGVSPVAIIVSAVFWTWLWGPVGLVLATPITVCLVVLGGHIPQMAFLRVLLGDEQVLDDDARIYNRLLSGATDEAVDVAEEFLEENSVQKLYDEVLVPVLEHAETDRNDEMLSTERYERLIAGMDELLESVNDRLAHIKAKKAAAESTDTDHETIVNDQDDQAEIESRPLPVKRIMCVPVNDQTDEMAAIMLKYLAQSRECNVNVLPAGSLASEVVDAVRDFDADIILLSSVPPFAVTHARYLAKRLASEFPGQKLYAGLWVGENSIARADERLREVGVEQIFTRLSEAALHL